jgi:hypothetical protein
MKKLLILWSSSLLLLFACQNKAPDHDEKNEHDSTMNKMQNDKPVSFAKIETLPTGIDSIFGKEPSKEVGYYKFSFPRADLKVQLDGITVDPRLAFTTWFSFAPMKEGKDAMLMGDIVLLENELPKVERKLIEEGISVTAIHNHLLNEKPKIMYLHVDAMGDPMVLSQKLKSVISLTSTPLKASFKDPAGGIKWDSVELIIGLKGKPAGPVLSFGIPRKEEVKADGTVIPPGFGIATGIGFQKVGDKAAITGDFVLMDREVSPVTAALLQQGITVTAIHNHMVMDSPRLFMMHFWAVGKPEDLARGLKAAIDKTNSKF